MKTSTSKVRMPVIFSILAVAVIGSVVGVNSLQTDESTIKSQGMMIGHVTLEVLDENGFVKAYRQSDNVIVNNGLDTMANNIFAGLTDDTEFDYIALGLDNTAASVTDTGLTAEITQSCVRDQVSAAIDNSNAVDGAVTISIDATFLGSACTGTGIVEAGVFDTSVIGAGNMFARNTFTTLNLDTADTLNVNWDFSFVDT